MVIPEPTSRSERWISSSVLRSHWHEPGAKLCSAEYQINNLLSPVFFREALELVPKGAIMVEVAPHGLLWPILRRALGLDCTCLGLMKCHEDNLTFFLSALGQLHTLGIQMDVSSLCPPVPWPVPRGTPPLSHLVSWDHSERWRVAKWNEFAGFDQSTEDVVEVDLGANEADTFFAGHQLDGGILFPATGYMVMAWKHLAKRYGKPFNQVSVIFEDVTVHRATILPKTGPVRFHVNLIQATGELVVAEAGSAVASGRIRIAAEGEKLVEKDPPGLSPETTVYELEAEDFYKDLRIRGYEHHGRFQAVLKTDFQSRNGRIKWENKWITFLDNMIQFFILPYTDRVFRLPVKMRSCRVDISLHDRVAQETSCAGLEIRIAPRRLPRQAVCLDEYKFVPYIDDESAKHERECCISKYMDVCNTIVVRVLDGRGENIKEVTGLTNGVYQVSENVVSRYLECLAENHILLRVLNDVKRNLKKPSSNLVSAVNSALETYEEDVRNDILNTALFKEDPLRHLLDVAVENTFSKKIRVLELATKSNGFLLTPLVSALLPMSNVVLKIDFIIAHPRPESLVEEKIPEGARTVTWDTDSSSQANFPDADLIIMRDVPGEIDRLVTLAEQLSKGCHEGGFVLLSYRTFLTPAEKILSTVGRFPMPHHAQDMVESLFRGFGFCLIGLKSNNVSTLMLLKKANVDVGKAKPDVIAVNNTKFDWVDILKDKVMNRDHKKAGQNVWILPGDSSASGVIGLIKCLRAEIGLHHIRCLIDISQTIQGNTACFITDSLECEKILEKDLVMNVFRNGQWGSYRHLSTQRDGPPKTQTEYAILNVETRGDLSSLRWYESALRCASQSSHASGVLCRVYYAPLNPRDVFLAKGELPVDALPGEFVRAEENTRKTAPASHLAVEAVARTWFYGHKSYVIIGGLGGFGLELATWMISRGYRRLLLSSRSGVQTGYQKFQLIRWCAAGAEVRVTRADASTQCGARQIVEEASTMGTVGGIFNLGLVLRDALLENQTPESFEAVCRVKMDATRHLDEISRDLCPELDHFVAFSSFASGHGNVGQTGYGYANAALERICELRVTDGLPGLAIQWGSIGDVGAFHESKGAGASLFGSAQQRIGSCLNVLGRFMNQKHPIVSSFVRDDTSSHTDNMKRKARNLAQKVAELFGVKDASSLDPRMRLGDLGMDSLVGVEIQQTLESDYDLTLSLREIRKLTVKKLREMGDFMGANRHEPNTPAGENGKIATCD